MIGCMVAPLLKELKLDCCTSLELPGGISLIIHIAIPNLDHTIGPGRIENLLNFTHELKRLCVPTWFHGWLEQIDFHLVRVFM